MASVSCLSFQTTRTRCFGLDETKNTVSIGVNQAWSFLGNGTDTNQASEYTRSMPGGQEAAPHLCLPRALLPIHAVADLTFALLLLLE